MVNSDASIGARVFLVVFGAFAAFSLWALADSWVADLIAGRVFLALFSFAAVFFGVSLALMGPLTVPRSIIAAAILAGPIAILVSWAGLRYDEVGQFLDDGAALSVGFLLVLLSAPFASVYMADRARWRDYATLFDTSWTITVRYLAGWLFVGVFWIVVFLSNALLELVDIDIIETLWEVDWVRFALSGAVLGLGLAVAYELRDYVSPRLILRLLRLLLPILLIVVGVFIAALPFRGLSQLFGELSSAAILMGVAIASISLISIALDRDDDQGIDTRGMNLAARALCLAVPILAGMAIWSVGVRVAQYGWTPERVLAAMVSVMLMIYGINYGVAALRRVDWGGAVRRANVVMAMIAAGVCVLWLTPVLNAERLSAQSQLARFDAGKTTVDELPLWEMDKVWGRAGQAALEDLAARDDDPDFEILAERLAALEQAESIWDFERLSNARAMQDSVVALIASMPVRPEGALDLSPELFADVPEYRVSRWSEGCARATEQSPTCVWISGSFHPDKDPRDQAVILFDTGGRVAADFIIIKQGKIIDRVRELYDLQTGNWAQLPPDAIARVVSGEFALVPSNIGALQVNGRTLVPAN